MSKAWRWVLVTLVGVGLAVFWVPRLIWRALVWILWDPEED